MWRKQEKSNPQPAASGPLCSKQLDAPMSVLPKMAVTEGLEPSTLLQAAAFKAVRRANVGVTKTYVKCRPPRFERCGGRGDRIRTCTCLTTDG